MNAELNRIVKACKIDSLNFASFCLKQNIDFLGIHILDEESIGKHKEISDYIKTNQGKVVIVTKIVDEVILARLVEYYEPAGIQLHFEVRPSLCESLRTLFPKLLIFGVITNHVLNRNLELLGKLHDYLIYDTSFEGGTNTKGNYEYFERFSSQLKKKTLLAGGITSVRVQELLVLNSGGFDIQSYFRTDYGISFKNLEKICDLLKFPRRHKVSVSLTDVSLEDIYQSALYYKHPNLEYHLDVSDGSLYTEFLTKTKSIEEKQQSLHQLPYSIHLFIKNEAKLKNIIERISVKHSLSLIKIFVQYYDCLGDEFYVYKGDPIKTIPSVFFKDIGSFISRSINSPFISIVVPTPQNRESVSEFFRIFDSNRSFFEDKEIWLDRNLELEYISLLKTHLKIDFNVIIGKGVVNDWEKIKVIYECLHNKI